MITKALFIVLCSLIINMPAQAQSLLTRTTMAENQLDGHDNRRRGFEPKKHTERHYGNKHENKHSPNYHAKRENRHHKKDKKHKRHNKHDYRSHKTRHHYHGNNYCEESHGSNDNYYSDNYQTKRHSKHNRGHRGRWNHAGDFRTKSRGDTTRVIKIHDKVSSLQLAASKRRTYVHRAFVEFANGQTRRVRNLEGELSWGDPLKHHFRHQRQVVALHLEVSKASRKRGYAKVSYKNH